MIFLLLKAKIFLLLFNITYNQNDDQLRFSKFKKRKRQNKTRLKC